MFKIAKLDLKENEKRNIYLSEIKKFDLKENEYNKYNVLNFEITNNDYSICFMIDYKINEYLTLPYDETINFNNYVVSGETWLKVNDLNSVEPIIDVKLVRYMNNKFIITAFFHTELNYNEDDYAGMIEFEFDIDEYIGNQ